MVPNDQISIESDMKLAVQNTYGSTILKSRVELLVRNVLGLLLLCSFGAAASSTAAVALVVTHD